MEVSSGGDTPELGFKGNALIKSPLTKQSSEHNAFAAEHTYFLCKVDLCLGDTHYLATLNTGISMPLHIIINISMKAMCFAKAVSPFLKE